MIPFILTDHNELGKKEPDAKVETAKEKKSEKSSTHKEKKTDNLSSSKEKPKGIKHGVHLFLRMYMYRSGFQVWLSL